MGTLGLSISMSVTGLAWKIKSKERLYEFLREPVRPNQHLVLSSRKGPREGGLTDHKPGHDDNNGGRDEDFN